MFKCGGGKLRIYGLVAPKHFDSFHPILNGTFGINEDATWSHGFR